MKKLLTIIIAIFWTRTAFAERSCSGWDADSSCSCTESKSGTIVHCSGSSGSYRVLSALSQVHMQNPWQLQLDSLDVNELPETVASVTALRLSNCNVRHLRRHPSRASWPNLNEVVFESVRFQQSLWPQLKGAPLLKFIKVSDVIISTIGQEFRDNVPSSVEYIELRKTSTSNIQSGCMSHLNNLRYVFISDMPITKLSRDVLPVEMPQLHTLVLGNTQIEKLESNFFNGMPKLQVLMLNGNQFSTLDAHLFMPLKSHLDHLLAERNPLQCKCNLLWLKNFQKKRSINVFATCYDETTEEVQEITDLQEDDYCL